ASAPQTLRRERNLELHPRRRTGECGEIEQLRLLGKDDLNDHAIAWIIEFQLEEMKLRDVGRVDPQIALPTNPRGEFLALHRHRANGERTLEQQLLGQIEVLERILPALLVGPLGRAALARQAAGLLEPNVLAHEFGQLTLDLVIGLAEV